MNYIPLAEAMRPHTLDDIVGQSHIVGDTGLLRRIIETKQLTSLILWGPPGTGKTTLARILARELKADFVELSAVVAGKKDVLAVVERAKQNWNLKQRTILFIDEIHRFNKAQQDAFLPHVESGLLTLIGATTENPSFEIISPLLSRSRVLVLEPLAKTDIIAILKRALTKQSVSKRVNKHALEYLAELSGGDARLALGNLEVALSLDETVTVETIKTAAQKRMPGYDKTGNVHYDVVSAFIKSLRGSDTTAALYYMSRMLRSGEDPKFIARRMVIFASEDVGLVGNGALALAVATFQAVERIGLPEAQYSLFHCAIALARSAKSREVADLMHDSLARAEQFPDSQVPLHMRNAPTKLMKELGYNEGYEWKANFKPNEGFLPKDIA